MKLSAQIALIISALALPLSAYAEEGENSKQTITTQPQTEIATRASIHIGLLGDGRGGRGSNWGSSGGGGSSSITRGPIDSSLSNRPVAQGGNYNLKEFNALNKNTTNGFINKNNAFSQTSPPAGQGASLKNTQDGKGSEERHGDKSEKENNRQDRDFYDRIQEGDRWR